MGRRAAWIFGGIIAASLAVVGGTLVLRAIRNPRLPLEPQFSGEWRLPSKPVKIASYNIEFGNRLDEALELLKAEAADVVCLQEIRPVQVREIEKALGMQGYWFSSSNLINNGAWGNAVFARGRVTSGQSFPNPKGGSFGAWAAVEMDGARFLAGSVHLMHAKTTGAGFSAREREIGALLDAVAKVGAPVLVAGDFNNPPIGKNYDLLTAKLADLAAGSGATHPSQFPLLRIDYIFGSREWEAESSKVIPSTVSDHRPVVVVVKSKVK